MKTIEFSNCRLLTAAAVIVLLALAKVTGYSGAGAQRRSQKPRAGRASRSRPWWRAPCRRVKAFLMRRTRRCDAIFMASHGRGALKQFLLGGVTQQVLARSSIPVRVFR